MNGSSLRHLDLIAIGCALVLAVVMGLTRGVAAGASSLAGSAVAIANLASLRVLLLRLVEQAREGDLSSASRLRLAGVYFVKLAVLALIVSLLLSLKSIDGLGLGIGFLAVSVAITLNALRTSGAAPTRSDATPSPMD